MIIELPDTTVSKISRALVSVREEGGAVALGRVLKSVLEPMLFEVKPTDITTLAGVAVILAVVALCAAVIPARRATRVDPIQALRSS